MQRRHLLAASGLGALSLSAPALLRAQSAKEVPAIWDVIVVGAGGAGLAAAVAATQAGAKHVLVLERGFTLGGHTILSTGFMGAIQRDPRESPERWEKTIESSMALFEKVGEGRGNPVLVRKLLAESGAAVDWLTSLGLVWVKQSFYSLGGISEQSHVSSLVRAGYDYVVTLKKAASRFGAEIHLRSQVRELVTDAQGTIRGVRTEEDGTLHHYAAHAVVLATGGFGANVPMRMKYDSRLDARFKTTANPYDKTVDFSLGDGILMAEAIGAATVDMDAIQTIPFWGGRLTDYVGADIFLDTKGERFVNEAASWKTIANALWKEPNQSCWVITDSQSVKGASRSVKLMNGTVREAQTIDEMAQGMGVAADKLKATIDRYNQFVKAGVDTDFGKKIFTQDISQAPFYYGKDRLYVHYCCGGLKFDEKARVLKADGTPIAGLFAAGEVTGGLHGADRVGGWSITDCMVFGRTAGTSAVAYGQMMKG